MSAEQVYQQIRTEKVIVIVRGAGKEEIVNIAQAVRAAGCNFLEVTCNTAGAAGMIDILCNQMPDMCIGAGTVITKQLAEEVLEAGAKYIIAPDTNPEVIKYCVAKDIAVMPGAATATEVLSAVRYGAKMIKIFPAACIGVDYIKQLKGPIDNVDFLAVGGVRVGNIKDFVAAGCVGIGIGGSVIKEEAVENADWQSITSEVAKYVNEIRN
ncbi:MAG: bifunctional 4-hydroxy-2-oxoglutarate aldolase/2-dehydro-3-deoxy-phosphogluconate aldolase [Planctomycetes bacterium]|nr:bifunctional 4-hydroxy-2-oxoglutarate aldolase/2-dehydro-3-deoxy-phosphogluconate aldolase [Planctomycetota bacterium]